jgi:hypothetical protein
MQRLRSPKTGGRTTFSFREVRGEHDPLQTHTVEDMNALAPTRGNRTTLRSEQCDVIPSSSGTADRPSNRPFDGRSS